MSYFGMNTHYSRYPRDHYMVLEDQQAHRYSGKHPLHPRGYPRTTQFMNRGDSGGKVRNRHRDA